MNVQGRIDGVDLEAEEGFELQKRMSQGVHVRLQRIRKVDQQVW